MPADEVRHEVLLLAGLLARLAERLREALVVLDGRLLHLVEHLRVGVLGGDAELAARVVARELADELGAPLGEVVAHAARDEDALDARLACARVFSRSTSGAWSVTRFSQMPGCTHERRRHALSVSLVLAAHLVHVRRRAADVGDGAAEVLHARQRAHLAQHAVGAAALDDAPLVLGDAAERAAAEAAAHRHDRVLDRLERRDASRRRSSSAGGARRADRRGRPSRSRRAAAPAG